MRHHPTRMMPFWRWRYPPPPAGRAYTAKSKMFSLPYPFLKVIFYFNYYHIIELWQNYGKNAFFCKIFMTDKKSLEKSRLFFVIPRQSGVFGAACSPAVCIPARAPDICSTELEPVR